jgi:hypothetical protein
MRILKIAIVSWLVLALSAPAFAGPPDVGRTFPPSLTDHPELRRTSTSGAQGGQEYVGPSFSSGAIAKAAQQTAPAPPQERGPIPKAFLWPGVVLFAGGMALAFNGFLNNKNGKFPEFGEATATNKQLGAAGLVTAFAGGTLLFLGTRKARSAPSVTFDAGRLTVSKQISW